MWKTLWKMWRSPLPQEKLLWKALWRKWRKNCIEGDKIIFAADGGLEFSGQGLRRFAGEAPQKSKPDSPAVILEGPRPVAKLSLPFQLAQRVPHLGGEPGGDSQGVVGGQNPPDGERGDGLQ